MQAISISFTLKGQDFDEIIKILRRIANLYPDCILIHGFMPRKEVLERGFPTTVVDFLDLYFPIQLNMYKGKPLRDEMVEVVNKLDAAVFIVGEVKEGVHQELELYLSLANPTLRIIQVPLGEEGFEILSNIPA